jgi:two-component system cell cycle sensor histidine kinase/response regulator CckA
VCGRNTFEPLFTTTEVGKATRLGQPQVADARQSRGFVRITSKFGRGTTFTISLPHTQAQLIQCAD